jgi:hypothetical protein
VPPSLARLRVTALVLTATMALPAGVRAHVTDSGCETTSPTFLLCETDHVRDVSCVCDGQKVTGCGGSVGRLFTQTRVALLKALRAANASDAGKISRNLTRARAHIERARTRTTKLQTHRHLDPACQEASAAAVESLKLWIALEFGDTTVPTTTTSTSTTPTGPGETTSTTLSVAASCFGDFAFYPIDMTQVTFAVWCNQAMTAFAINVPGGRTITADVGPDGFTCGQPEPGMYRCDGALPADLWVRGRIQVAPSAVTGMGGGISGFQGDVEFGPFPMGGP